MMSHVFLSSALLTTILAAPTLLNLGSTANIGTTTGLESQTFENLPSILSTQPEFVVGDIYWEGMSITNTGGIQNAIMVTPNSGVAYLSYGHLNLVTLQQGQPSMKVTYPGSKLKSFGLANFYYGCSLGTPVSIAALPVTCTITIKGYNVDVGGTPVATQSFDFNVPILHTNANMVQAVPSSAFRNLKRVDFSVSNSLTTYAHIDTIAYIPGG